MPRRPARLSTVSLVPAWGAILVALTSLLGVALAAPGAASAVDPRPNLTVSVTASPGTVLVGQPWTWTATIANSGTVAATFGAGTRVFLASLPADTIAAFSGATSGRDDVTCTVDGSPDLVCTAPAGASIAAGASFSVGVTGVASAAATLLLPRTGGSCAVDPANVVPETSEINFCASSMKVSVASTATTITGHAPDPSIVGVPASVTWTVSPVAPAGGTPGGTVTVSDGTQSCSAPVADGGCAIAFASEGTRTLVATYGGAAGSYTGSTSAAVTHGVVPPVPPNVTGLVRLDPDPTLADTVRWALAFDRPVTGVDATDLALAAGGTLVGAAVTGVDGAGTAWTVTASTGTGDGTLRLSVVDDDSILAAGAAPLGDVGTGNGDYAGEAYTVDRTPPDTTITSGPATVTADPQATIAFSGTDDGTGVDGFACSLDEAPFERCSSPLDLTVGEGRHELRVRAIDAVGNHDPTPASRTWRVDTVAPTVTVDQAPDQPDPASGDTIRFRVEFSEPVAGFTAADVDVRGGAGASAVALSELAPNDGTRWEARVSGMTGAGRVVASIPPGAAADAAGNPSEASTGLDDTVAWAPPAPANEPPGATVVDGSCAELAAAGTLAFALDDPDGDPMTFALVADDNPGLVPPTSVVVAGEGGSRDVTVTPAPQRSGIATLAFRLSDGTESVRIVVTVIAGGDRDGPLTGTPGVDMLFGLGGPGVLAGGAGTDLLCGGNGDDVLDGGGGTDFLFGGNGNDALAGGGGDDGLSGGRGDDALAGGAGADRFAGGPGNDRLLDLAAADGDTTDGS